MIPSAKEIPLLVVLTFLCFGYQSSAQSVDQLTGRFQMSVPLGGLQANDISIPIAVYHSGSSLKVTEGEGDCGLGWNLNVNNFSVTRFIRGLPDEINTAEHKGWLSNNNGTTVQGFVPSADDNLVVCTDETSDWNFINNNFGSFINDSEPDLFYISGPGISAEFVLDPSGTPKLLTHQEIIIEFLPDVQHPDDIVVKTNNGMVYTFALREFYTRKAFKTSDVARLSTEFKYYENYGENGVLCYSKWRLTNVTSAQTGTEANFTYNNPSPEEFHTISGAGRHFYNTDSSFFVHDTQYSFELESISLKSYTATFSWSNKRLSKLTLQEANTLEKKITEFSYQSATSPSTTSVTKSFLKEIRMVGDNCNPTKRYEFDYYNVGSSYPQLPASINWKKNWGQDYFGFPNGVAGNRNKPTLYLNAAQSDGRRLRVTPVPGGGSSVLTGENRSVSASNIVGALKNIRFPMGGYLEVQYEPNNYFDNSTSEEFSGGGIRVKKLVSQGGEIAFGKDFDQSNSYRALTKEYEYKLAGGNVSSGLLLSPIKLGYIVQDSIKHTVDNLGEYPSILYSRVKEKVSGQGSTVYEFNIPGVFPETVNGEWKATKSRIARPNPGAGSCAAYGFVANGYYLYPYAPSSNYDFKRGQISKITEYTESGTAIREKSFTYTSKTSNPSTIKGLRFERIESIYYYGVYEILTGRMEVVSQEVVKEASHEDATKWFQTTTAYAYNPNLMLETVTATLPDNTATIQKFKYAKDFQFTSPAATDTAAVALKALNMMNRGSEIVEQHTKVTLPGVAQTVTSAKLITYRDFGGNRVLPYYIKTLPKGAALTEAFVSSDAFTADTDYRTVQTFKEYDNESRVLTAFDDKRNTISNHYATDISLPVTTFANAKAQQAVYEGFEMSTTFGLTAEGSDFQYPAGWTGSKAISFTSNTSKLKSSATDLIVKSGNKYRVSFWVYSEAGKTVTFTAKDGTTSVATLALTNITNNKWNYLEGEIDVTAAPSLFSIEISTNASGVSAVTLDDIVFIPSRARVALQTALPFKGSTSATDDRGNSVKNTYDLMGRLVNTMDRNRNLIQRNEYAVKNVPTPKPPAGFTHSADEVFVNTPVVFTPMGAWACDPTLTYGWEVDGAAQPSGPGNQLIYTFTTPGQHTVSLTVTSSVYNTSETSNQVFCVGYPITGTFSVSITDQNGNPINIYDCNSVPQQINYELIMPEGLPPGTVANVSWQTSYEPDGNQGTIITYTATYSVSNGYFKDCAIPGVASYQGQASNSITQVYNPLCQ